jgi:hypothetical protein
MLCLLGDQPVPGIDLSRRPPPKIEQLREFIWLCVLTNRPPDANSLHVSCS